MSSSGDFEPPVPLPWMGLRVGETLLWAGQPSRSRFVSRLRCIWLTMFGLVVAGVIGRGILLGLSRGEWESVGLSVPFLALGLYVEFVRFIISRYLRPNTSYALTQERIMIHRSGLGGRDRKKSLARVSDIRKRINDDGSGTIWFSDAPDQAAQRFGSKRRSNEMHLMGLDEFQLHRIPDAATVVALLENSTEYNHVSDSRPAQDGRPAPSPWQEG